MKDTIKFMLRLVAATVSGDKLPEAPSSVDWQAIYNISANHNVANIITYAVLNGGYSLPAETKQAFVNKMYKRISLDD